MGPGMALPAGPSPFRCVSASGEGHRAGQGPPGLNPPGKVVGPAALRTLLCSSGLLQRAVLTRQARGSGGSPLLARGPTAAPRSAISRPPFQPDLWVAQATWPCWGCWGLRPCQVRLGGFPNTDTLLLPPVAPTMSCLTTATANTSCVTVFSLLSSNLGCFGDPGPRATGGRGKLLATAAMSSLPACPRDHDPPSCHGGDGGSAMAWCSCVLIVAHGLSLALSPGGTVLVPEHFLLSGLTTCWSEEGAPALLHRARAFPQILLFPRGRWHS